MTEDRERRGRKALGELVTRFRLEKFGSVQDALRVSGLNRATWLRIEDGERVRDDRLVAAESALGWRTGTALEVIRLAPERVSVSGNTFTLYFGDDSSDVPFLDAPTVGPTDDDPDFGTIKARKPAGMSDEDFKRLLIEYREEIEWKLDRAARERDRP